MYRRDLRRLDQMAVNAEDSEAYSFLLYVLSSPIFFARRWIVGVQDEFPRGAGAYMPLRQVRAWLTATQTKEEAHDLWLMHDGIKELEELVGLPPITVQDLMVKASFRSVILA